MTPCRDPHSFVSQFRSFLHKRVWAFCKGQSRTLLYKSSSFFEEEAEAATDDGDEEEEEEEDDPIEATSATTRESMSTR